MEDSADFKARLNHVLSQSSWDILPDIVDQFEIKVKHFIILLNSGGFFYTPKKLFLKKNYSLSKNKFPKD